MSSEKEITTKDIAISEYAVTSARAKIAALATISSPRRLEVPTLTINVAAAAVRRTARASYVARAPSRITGSLVAQEHARLRRLLCD